MPQQEFLSQKVCETRDEAWLERASFAGVRIAHEHEEGVMVSGIAAETLPRDLRMRCMEALARYRAATGREPAWLFIDSTEEKIVVR
jgi:alkanesulfonate monooxygenase SsuD/methylene tetrahydromethanopterin reductase-like flavin-dependent oxidoreductase (luciferase family)